MAAADPLQPLPAGLQVIRRLTSSLQRHGSAGAPRHHHQHHHHHHHPSRDDVPLLDPCCGLLSAGAEAHLGVRGRRSFMDFHHVPSGLRPQTTPSPSGIRGEKARSCREAVGAALQAKPSGWRSVAEIPPDSARASSEAPPRRRAPDKHGRLQNSPTSGVRLWANSSPAVPRYRPTSAAQRSCEEVQWNAKLAGRLNAADRTLEKLVDLVCERPSMRRYHRRPQLWQSVGAEWDRQQLRLRTDATKPVSFCSPCPRSGQIPLYTGSIGSDNMDNIDNMEGDFHPLTLKRSVIPPYTPTAHRNTIPGYTGRAAYSHRASAAQPASHPQACFQTGVGGRAAPLSRLVTTTTPCNPSLRPALPVSRADIRRDTRRGR